MPTLEKENMPDDGLHVPKDEHQDTVEQKISSDPESPLAAAAINKNMGDTRTTKTLFLYAARSAKPLDVMQLIEARKVDVDTGNSCDC
ncbi:hypothetical protein ACHAPT_005544 [Fusarium lateritium]